MFSCAVSQCQIRSAVSTVIALPKISSNLLIKERLNNANEWIIPLMHKTYRLLQGPPLPPSAQITCHDNLLSGGFRICDVCNDCLDFRPEHLLSETRYRHTLPPCPHYYRPVQNLKLVTIQISRFCAAKWLCARKLRFYSWEFDTLKGIKKAQTDNIPQKAYAHLELSLPQCSQ